MSHGEGDTWRAMSQENVELVRRGYEAYAAGDLASVAGLFAPMPSWRTAVDSESRTALQASAMGLRGSSERSLTTRTTTCRVCCTPTG